MKTFKTFAELKAAGIIGKVENMGNTPRDAAQRREEYREECAQGLDCADDEDYSDYDDGWYEGKRDSE